MPSKYLIEFGFTGIFVQEKTERKKGISISCSTLPERTLNAVKKRTTAKE